MSAGLPAPGSPAFETGIRRHHPAGVLFFVACKFTMSLTAEL